jgi:hypothetical protein
MTTTDPIATVSSPLRITLDPDGPYCDPLFRRLMAARLSGGYLLMAGIAFVVTALGRSATDSKRFQCEMSPRWMAREIPGEAGALLNRKPVTDPRFLDQLGRELPDVLYMQDAAAVSVGYFDVPQERYIAAPPPRNRSRNGRARTTHRLPARATKREFASSDGSYFDRIGWQELYSFNLAMAALPAAHRRILDRLVMGARQEEVAVDLGSTAEVVEGQTRDLLLRLNVPSVAKAALLAGLLDERRP